MVKRQIITEFFSKIANNNMKVVGCLGGVSRDLYCFGELNREHIFYCVGSMGSVLPFSLGMAMAREDLRIIALEGDGSMIMNLGSLVTLKRYPRKNLLLVILDNKVYETTGGQQSQPPSFSFQQLCISMGLTCTTLTCLEDIMAYFSEDYREWSHSVIVIEMARDKISPRISESPVKLMFSFKNGLNDSK